MKTPYSTFSHPIWKSFKQQCKDRSYASFINFGADYVDSCIRRGIIGLSRGEVDCLMCVLNAVAIWNFDKITHYFLEPGIEEFCEDSVREFTGDYRKQMDLIMNDSYVQSGFAVHFPAAERRSSILVIPQPVCSSKYFPEKCAYNMFACDNEALTLIGDEQIEMPDDPEELTQDLHIRKFVYGLSLFMDAFPDTIVKSCDGDIHRPLNYNGERIMVKRNEIMDEEEANDVSPHWRRGHFRVLYSERFVRKKGQTVFVKGSFVKGHSFDITGLSA